MQTIFTSALAATLALTTVARAEGEPAPTPMLPEPAPAPPAPATRETEVYSKGMIGGGVVLAAIGVTGTLAGAVMLAKNPDSSFDFTRPVGGIILGSSLLLFAVPGAVLIGVGAHEVPVEPRTAPIRPQRSPAAGANLQFTF